MQFLKSVRWLYSLRCLVMFVTCLCVVEDDDDDDDDAAAAAVTRSYINKWL